MPGLRPTINGPTLPRWFAAAVAIVVAVAAFVTAAEPGYAQQAGKRTFLDFLFGKRTQTIQRRQDPIVRKPRRKAVATPDIVQIQTDVAKNADARHLLVVGDFMAKALGDGLTTAFAQSPDIVVDVRSNGSSGLVRTDYYDWAARLPELIDETKASMVIVMLGANDRQQMSVDGKKEKFRSDPWIAAYQQRVAGLAEQMAGRKIPFAWVGLPAFQSDSMTTDAATLNGYFRTATEKAGGEFVDIWDGFVDENGKFAYSGSDINGQSVRLRGSDGLTLTKAGKRKLAFYVEKPIRHVLGNPDATSLLRLDTPSLGKTTDDNKAPVVIVSTPPISLADPELDGASMLLDAPMLPKASGTSPRDKLVLSGDTGPAPEGRVDDYVIKKPVPATP